VGVACVFGLTDLDQEKCMATAGGPYLIDAEMGFSYPRLPTKNMVMHTAIRAALQPVNVPASVVLSRGGEEQSTQAL
jgi:hypothetical protein